MQKAPKIFKYKDDWVDKDYAVEELNVIFNSAPFKNYFFFFFFH